MHIPGRRVRQARALRAALIATAVVGGLLATTAVADSQTPAFVSHDFNSCVVPGEWTFIDPIGDSSVAVSGAGSGDAQLRLSVSAGAAHDPWNGNNTTARVMEPAADTDFMLEVKFDSSVDSRYQEQGVLIEQDALNWVRFDSYSDGSQVHVFAATTTGGVSAVKGNVAVGGATPGYLRIERVGDSWTQRYSFDGVTWTAASTFTHAIAVTQIGVFAGNFATAGNAPAHTAVVDYFYELPGSLTTEDQGTPAGQATLVLQSSGQGAVDATPAGPTYPCGATVELAATPDTGWSFQEWSGDLAGTANPAQLLLSGDAAVTATFTDLTNYPPVISDIAAATSHEAATITWTTDEPATSFVSYGPTAAYEDGTVGDAALVTAHAVTLTGLTPESTYHYRAESADGLGAASQSGDLTFTTLAAPIGGAAFTSDDFNAANLDTDYWAFVNPPGVATVAIDGAGTSDARLRVELPAGVAHDAWGNNNAAQVVQLAADTDFTIEVKIDSPLTARYQSQGVVVHQDANDWLRFDFYYDGSTVRAFAASTENGTSQARLNGAVSLGTPMWMRVARQGDNWTQSYSGDGVTWTENGTFTRVLTVAAVGMLAGNQGSGGVIPAHTAIFDYFFDTAAPVLPEDGVLRPDTLPPLIHAAAVTATSSTVSTQWATDEVATGEVRYGLTAAYELGAVPQPVPGRLHAVQIPGLASGTLYHVQLVAQDGGSRTATSNYLIFTTGGPAAPPVISDVQASATHDAATVTWTTDQPATSAVSYGLTSAYELGTVSDGALVTAHSLALSGLLPETTYHYEAASANADGQLTVSGDLTFTTAAVPLPAVRSDDFNAPNLDTGLWTFIDPLSNSRVSMSGTGTSDAHLVIAVPEGASHDPWGTNRAARVMQPALDADFVTEVKIDSAFSLRYQSQGILVEQNDGNWLRFDFYYDGSAVHAFAASTVNGNSAVRANTVIANGGPLWLRVERQGDQWLQSYSYDGLTWILNASFVESLTVTAVGAFAGNFAASGPAPAHSVWFDYFFNAAAPVTPEDGNPAPDTLPPLIHALSMAPGGDSAAIGWATDEAATGLVRYGLTTAYELGTVPQGLSGLSHGVTLLDLAGDTMYHLQIEAQDGGARTSVSPDLSFTTGPQSTLLSIDAWYGDSQQFGALGVPQHFANVLGNVSDPAAVQSLTYSLNGGPETVLSVGPDPRRLDEAGDFNIELAVDALMPGSNTVRITAIDTLSQAATRTITVNWTDGTTWPLPASVDWSTATVIHDVAQVVDGRWQLTPAGVRPLDTGYDRLIAIGDRTWTDYEVTLPVTVHSIDHLNGDPSPSNGPVVGLGLRWQGHTQISGEQPRRGFWPAGAYAWYRWTPWGAERYELSAEGLPLATNVQPFVIGQTYLFKMRVYEQPGGYGRYLFKSWPQGDPEPAGWTVGLDAASDLSSGSLLLIAHHADVTFGNITITPFAP